MNTQLLLEVVGLGLDRGCKRKNAGVFALADAPHMQIANVGFDWAGNDDLSDLSNYRGIHLGIEQHTT